MLESNTRALLLCEKSSTSQANESSKGYVKVGRPRSRHEDGCCRSDRGGGSKKGKSFICTRTRCSLARTRRLFTRRWQRRTSGIGSVNQREFWGTSVYPSRSGSIGVEKSLEFYKRPQS